METVSSAPDENTSSTRRRTSVKSEEGTSRQEGGRSSPPPNCAICLGRCRNKSFTDSCLHQFCFKCLVTWSKVKTECPLCKQTFKSIIHNVKSNHQYEEYQVEQQPTPEDVLDRIDLRQLDAATGRYRFRATLTMPRVHSLAFHRFLMSYPISTIVREGYPPEYGSHQRSRVSPAAFRRTVYRHNLWARPLPDFTGRFRDCTPEFYRYNDSQIHRLLPWLNRELHYLLNDNAGHISYVLTRIVELLPQHHITSPEFRESMHRYFGERTEHFLHEFYCYASTPYDLTGYDRNVQYTGDPRGAVRPGQLVDLDRVRTDSDSDDSVDSDIVMVSSSHPAPSERPAASTSAAPAAAAGPSSYRSAYPTDPSVIPIETISHSDTDDDSSEVMVVGYIKPPHQRTPEVVDLVGSDSDVVLQEPTPSPSYRAEPAVRPEPVAVAAAAPVPAPLDVAEPTPVAPPAPPQPQPRLSSMVKLKLTRRPPVASDSDSDETYTPSPPPPPRRKRRTRPKAKKTSRSPRKDRKRSEDAKQGRSKTDKKKSKNGKNVKSTRKMTLKEGEEPAGPSGVVVDGGKRKRSTSSRRGSRESKRLKSVVKVMSKRNSGYFGSQHRGYSSSSSSSSGSVSDSSDEPLQRRYAPRTSSDSRTPHTSSDSRTPHTSSDSRTPRTSSDGRAPRLSCDSRATRTRVSQSDSEDDVPLNLTCQRLRMAQELNDSLSR